jgi:hypothetical protein
MRMEKKRFDLYYTYNSDPIPFSVSEQTEYIRKSVEKITNQYKNQLILLCFEYCYDKGILKECELGVPFFMKQVEFDTEIDLEKCPEDLILKMFKMIKVFLSD